MEDSRSTSDTCLNDERLSQSSQNNQFIQISFDKSYFVAGENVNGEILLNINSINSYSKVRLLVEGIESVKVHKPNGETSQESRSIFKLKTCLQQWNESTAGGQYIFPFTFKTPQFAPATFSFSSTDEYENFIDASVVYIIETEFITGDTIALDDRKEVILRNKNSRLALKNSVSELQTIKSCFCFLRGLSSIVLSCEQAEHSIIGHISSFNIDIKDNLAVLPISMVSQVVFDLEVSFKDDKKYSFTTLVSRCMPEISSNGAGTKRLSFEADLGHILYGENPCSNEGSLFQANYKAQAFLLYNIGCRTKRVTAELPIHVNPRLYDRATIKLPNRWSPKSCAVANLIVETVHIIDTDGL